MIIYVVLFKKVAVGNEGCVTQHYYFDNIFLSYEAAEEYVKEKFCKGSAKKEVIAIAEFTNPRTWEERDIWEESCT